jgi:hypothetical protein
LLFSDGSIDVGLVVMTSCQALWVVQKIAYQSKKTANLLGIYQTVISPQEYRHYIDRRELAGACDDFSFCGP